MHHQLIILVFIFMVTRSEYGYTQGELSLSRVDSITYAALNSKDWKGLIHHGKVALAAGIDFYYLQVRLGIAYYEKGNYHQALAYFENAYKQNQEEEYLQEYLYYSYLFTDRWSEASLLAEKFSHAMKLKTGIAEKSFITGVDLAYGYTGLADKSVTENYSATIGIEEDGNQFIPQKLHSYFVGLQHRVSPRFLFYHAYTGLQLSHFHYSQSEGTPTTDADVQSNLSQYYASGNVALNRNLNMVFGIHAIHIRYPVETQGFRQGNPFSITTSETENDFVGFFSLSQKFRYVTLGGSFYYGGLNYARQYQKDLKVTLLPMGNKNLYTVSLVSHQTQNTLNQNSFDRVIFEQQVGIKVTRKLWLEAYGSFGDLNNFMLNDGLIIFNRLDVILNRYGASLLIYPNPRWSIKLDYAYLKGESSFFPDDLETNYYNTLQYNQHSFNGIVSWRF